MEESNSHESSPLIGGQSQSDPEVSSTAVSVAQNGKKKGKKKKIKKNDQVDAQEPELVVEAPNTQSRGPRRPRHTQVTRAIKAATQINTAGSQQQRNNNTNRPVKAAVARRWIYLANLNRVKTAEDLKAHLAAKIGCKDTIANHLH